MMLLSVSNVGYQDLHLIWADHAQLGTKAEIGTDKRACGNLRANSRIVGNSEVIQDWPRKLIQYRNLVQAGKSQAAGAAPGRNS
jgi:hypothetical protein